VSTDEKIAALEARVAQLEATVDSLTEIRKRKEREAEAAFASEMARQEAEVRAAAEAERQARRTAILSKLKIETVEVAPPSTPGTVSITVPFGGSQLAWPHNPTATLETKRLDELIVQSSLERFVANGTLRHRAPTDAEINTYLRERGV
jgi:hypothetical protein